MPSKKGPKQISCVLEYPAHACEPLDYVTFLELRPFYERWHDLGLDDADLQLVQVLIAVKPGGNPVIPGTGGLRKMRCGRRDSAKGKSAGYRVCYVYFPEFVTVLLVSIYAKNEQDDIPERQKPLFRSVIARIEKQLAAKTHKIKSPTSEEVED
jgi:hypothetical protein